MKKFLHLYIVLLLTVFFLSCEEGDDTAVEVTDTTINAANFYPGEAGSSFEYEGEMENDSTSVPTGRKADVESGKTISGTVYLGQINTTTISGVETSPDTLYYRKDEAGVYFYVNSEAFLEFLDSLGIAESDVELSADAEIILISYPFSSSWSAFSLTIDSYKGLPINVDIMALTASYEGEEDVTVEAVDESITAKKIIYTAKIGLPDAYEAYFPDDIPSIEAEATAWFAEDIGLVKTEGSSFIIGAISGGDIEISDSSFVMTETLVDYDIVSE